MIRPDGALFPSSSGKLGLLVVVCTMDGTTVPLTDGIADGSRITVGPGSLSLSPTNVGKSVVGGDDGYKEFANKDDGGMDGDVVVR